MNYFKYVIILLSALLASRAGAQEFSVSTNALGYLNLGTINMEAAMGVSRHWSVNLDLRYNPFTYPGREGVADQMQSRQRTVALGGRFWPWHIHSGWWLAGKAQYQEFNVGGLTEAETREGDRVGGGLTGGYTYMLSPHFNIEAGAGFWAGHEIYTVYACPECGRKVDSGEKNFILANDLILGLVYVF